MKFINYQIPIGLGVSQPNTYSNNHNNVNGITEESKKKSYKLSKLQLQSGGQMYNTEPCETVFYIFDHPIIKEHDDKDEELSVKLTDDEALSEEIELNKVDSKENEYKQSKLVGEIISDKSVMKNSLRELISDTINNSNKEDDTVEDAIGDAAEEEDEEETVEEDEQINEKETSGKSSGKKIRSLKRLFENKSEDDDIYIGNYDDVNSHDTLNSILRALKKSTGGTK